MKSVEESFPSMKLDDNNDQESSTINSDSTPHYHRFGHGRHHRRHFHHLHAHGHPHAHHFTGHHPHFHHNPHFQAFLFPPHHHNTPVNEDMVNNENKNDMKEWKRGMKKEWRKEFRKHGCHWKKHGFENLEAGNEAQTKGFEKFGGCRRRGMKLARLERLKNTSGFDEAEFQTKLEALENLNLKTGLLAQILIAKSMVKAKANNQAF